MFKNVGGFENEIYHSMQNNLSSSQLENKYSFDKLARATDYLNAAADLFDKANMKKEAEEVIGILSVLAKQLSSRQ